MRRHRAYAALGLLLGIVLAACGTSAQRTTAPAESGAAVSTPRSAEARPSLSPAALPTPDADGNDVNLTLAQAQQLAPFHLVQPTWIPSYLQEAGITASVSTTTEARSSTPAAAATPPTGPIQVVSLNFRGPFPKPFAVTINEMKQGTPLRPVPGQDASGSSTATIAIGGRPVTRTTWAIIAVYPPPGPDAVYVWTDQGTTFQLTAILGGVITEQDAEHVIASMLGQGS